MVHRLDDNQAIKRNLRWELSQLLKERFQEKLQLVAFFCEIKRKLAKCLEIHDASCFSYIMLSYKLYTHTIHILLMIKKNFIHHRIKYECIYNVVQRLEKAYHLLTRFGTIKLATNAEIF